MTLRPGFSIDASAAPASGWATLVSAEEIIADGVDFGEIAFVNGSVKKGTVRLNGGNLEAKMNNGFSIIFK